MVHADKYLEINIKGLKHEKEPIRCLGIYVGHDKDKCEDFNWKEKIKKMEKLLKSWEYRNLTLFGKVVIIKSLAISSLVFSAMNTTTSKWAIHSINNIIYNFLWKGHDKVKRKTIIGGIEDGGLNMVEIDSFFKLLKAGWAARILNNQNQEANWSFIGNSLFKQIGLDKTIFGINDNTFYKHVVCSKLPEFYKQVIEGYCSCNNINYPSTHDELMNTSIWGNNTFLNKSKNIIYFPEWIKSGVVYVKDLQFQNNILDEKYIHRTIHKRTNIFSEIFQLKSALAIYKHIINTNIPNKENNININIVSLPKFYYHSLIQEIFKKPISENKWLQQFRLNTYDFTSTYITKIKKIRDKKIAEFNYKLIHRIIPCKYKLQKWGLTNNNACFFCGQIETVEHMLFLCENVRYMEDIPQ